ncbi:TPA: hypothetical protein MYH88_001026 [Klebsiella pneumoniae]|nr:hypothetical protein [Klebsiella pneumoniae]MDK1765319.1 hypothetical protein [Klebsiella pneumoniae]MEE4426488.1 hypothetical protein [Klebsiella pneumoniae]HCA8418771.1 hypothetical protein [Klebsiella pneumoniae]HCA8423253.1 hypothetical protein [Klebsiella pneumoniae]HCA8434923.1 hypothetical protein [Klebsiella pneumoniae]
MSEIMDLVVIEKKNAMAVFTNNDQLDPLIEAIEKEARSLVPDVTTKKGRDAIASMAHKVARSKTYIDNAGKDLVAELKALPKQIDESRRVVRERLDALKDEVRRPLTEWEVEQDRLKKEEVERIAAEAYSKMRDEADRMNADFDVAMAEARKIKFEADHELALLMDKDIDRERADKAAEAERQRIAHEEEIKRLAEEKAKREAAEQAQREIDAAAAREREAILAKERAERERIEAQQRAEREQREAAERAEREKQAAVEAERRKAQEEADRIRREAEQRELARLAEEKRKADEQARREADVKHRKAVGVEVVKALMANTSLTRDQAIEVLTAVKDGRIPHTGISY